MKKLALLAAVLLIAGTAMASNTGFKLNYDVPFYATAANNVPVSLPYFYFPAGYPDPNGQVTANDLCDDAGADLAQVQLWNPAFDTFTNYNCGSVIGDYQLEAGVGYILVPTAPFTFNIVGSHDDEFRPGGGSNITLQCAAGTSCNNWVSIPYHSMADVYNDNAQTSPPFTALCEELNNGVTPSNVAQIQVYNSEFDTITNYNCGGLGGGDALIPGQAVIMIPAQDGVQVQIETY